MQNVECTEKADPYSFAGGDNTPNILWTFIHTIRQMECDMHNGYVSRDE